MAQIRAYEAQIWTEMIYSNIVKHPPKLACFFKRGAESSFSLWKYRSQIMKFQLKSFLLVQYWYKWMDILQLPMFYTMQLIQTLASIKHQGNHN